jgi:6-pyruvoyltetrahydropterin/6-carboxytetrahydropterin synthase
MYKVSKEFHFSAAHHLFGLPPEHLCSNPHGHNYVITVELSNTKLDEVGFVTDYRALEPIKKYIDEVLDHKDLNNVLICNTTAENIAKHIFLKFKPSFPNLSAVKVSETPKTIATYTPDYDG